MSQQKENAQPTPLVRQGDSETMPDPKKNTVTPKEANSDYTNEEIQDEEIQKQIQQ